MKDSQKSGSDLQARAKNIAKHMKLDMENFKVGRTLVLYRAREYRKCTVAIVFLVFISSISGVSSISRNDCGYFNVSFEYFGSLSCSFPLFSLCFEQVPWN